MTVKVAETAARASTRAVSGSTSIRISVPAVDSALSSDHRAAGTVTTRTARATTSACSDWGSAAITST